MIRHNPRRALEQQSHHICFSCLSRLYARHGRQIRQLRIPSHNPAVAPALRAAFDEGRNGKETGSDSFVQGDAFKKFTVEKTSIPSPPTQAPDALATSALLEAAQKRYQNSIGNRPMDDKVGSALDTKGSLAYSSQERIANFKKAERDLTPDNKLMKSLMEAVLGRSEQPGPGNSKSGPKPLLIRKELQKNNERTEKELRKMKKKLEEASAKESPGTLDNQAFPRDIDVPVQQDDESVRKPQEQADEQGKKEKPAQTIGIAQLEGPRKENGSPRRKKASGVRHLCHTIYGINAYPCHRSQSSANHYRLNRGSHRVPL